MHNLTYTRDFHYAVAIMLDRVQYSPDIDEPEFGQPPDVLEDLHAFLLWPHETD